MGLPDHLRRESLGLTVLLDDWHMRDHARDKAAAMQAAVHALGIIDGLVSALEGARDTLASELHDARGEPYPR
jgi:hypothetical protein